VALFVVAKVGNILYRELAWAILPFFIPFLFTNLYILAKDRYGAFKFSLEYKALGVNTTFIRSIFN